MLIPVLYRLFCLLATSDRSFVPVLGESSQTQMSDGQSYLEGEVSIMAAFSMLLVFHSPLIQDKL